MRINVLEKVRLMSLFVTLLGMQLGLLFLAGMVDIVN